MAYEYRKFYIDGQWVDPAQPKEFKVINPATEEVAGVISMGNAADVDRAVAAARRAFDSFSQTTPDDRRGLLEKILEVYKKRYTDVANAIRDEMGAPNKLANGSQAGIGVGHLTAMIDVLKNFKFEERHGPDAPGVGADRCLRADHALELAHQPGGCQGGSGAGCRLHHGSEAVGILAFQRDGLG